MIGNAIPESIAAPDYNTAVYQWFIRMGQYCASVDYEAAHSIFAADVVSFGTKSELMNGLDALQAHQWEAVWPNIQNFAFDMDSIQAGGDQNVAWGAATWSSTGYDENGKPYHRPGRATVILERRGGSWRAIHSHFSLFPGTPHRTFGPGE